MSLCPLLERADAKWDYPSVTTHFPNCHGVRDERWRYIRYDDGSEELYDHSKDPNEWTNLAELPEFAPVKARFARWLPTINVEPVGR